MNMCSLKKGYGLLGISKIPVEPTDERPCRKDVRAKGSRPKYKTL